MIFVCIKECKGCQVIENKFSSLIGIMEQVRDSTGNRYWLVQIPKDGDCLFGSLVHQIYGVTPKNQLFKPYSKQLRETAVREIRNHPDLYYHHLAYYANEIVHDDWPIEMKIEEYLRRLECPGFWGGSECLAAVSNYFVVCIHIYQDTTCIKFEPETESFDLRICEIFYHGEGLVKTHYDSIICKRPYDYALDPLPNIPIDTAQLADCDFTVSYQVLEPIQDSLVASVGHQLTGSPITTDNIVLLKCLVADELQSQSPSTLSLLEIPATTEGLSNYIFHLKLGRLDGGRSFLVLLSSLLNITIYVHSTRSGSYRIASSTGDPTVAVHLLERNSEPSVSYASVLRMNRGRTKRSSLPSVDPLEVADKVARMEVHATPEVSDKCVLLDSQIGMRFASLNVNGCRTVEKRDSIDFYLLSQNVHLAALQEVNLQGADVKTSHYRWYLGQKSSSKKRGLALLVRSGFDVKIQFRKNHGSNIQFAEVTYEVIVN